MEFRPGQYLLHIESRGPTVVGKNPGAMVVRIAQNNQRLSLPPDLIAAAPRFSPRVNMGELATLIDMDHYIEGTFDPDSEWVVSQVYEVHDHIIKTFREHVVTREAIEEWKWRRVKTESSMLRGLSGWRRALMSGMWPRAGTETPQACSSWKRMNGGTRVLRSWSFRQSRPVRESTAVT